MYLCQGSASGAAAPAVGFGWIVPGGFAGQAPDTNGCTETLRLESPRPAMNVHENPELGLDE